MYEAGDAIRSFLALSLIDKHFHEDELSFILDIAEEEFEFTKEQVFEEKEKLEKLDKDEIKKIFQTFIESVPEREKNYFFDLYSRLSLVDTHLHKDEIDLLSGLEKKWNILKENSKTIIFDEDQRKVIETNKSERLLVIASPGCGKTAVAAERCLNLTKVQNVSASNILVLSFSRNAVKEFRDRIEARSDLNTEPIKLSTIDQQTFAFLRGWGELETKKYLEKGYEYNIIEFKNRLLEKDQDIINDLKSFKHLIIDEAQDITGERSLLIQEFIKNLDKDCGVTVFGDPHQAIYGWTDEEGTKKEKDVLFLDSLEELKFKKLELKKIYRTNNQELEEIFKKYRLPFLELKEKLSDDEFHYEDYKLKKQALFKDHTIESDGIVEDISKSKTEKNLFLFRKKSEMLAAANKAFENNVRVSLRFGGSPNCIYPWVGSMFCDYFDNLISKKQFLEIWNEKKIITFGDVKDPEFAWDLVFKTARKKDDVDVKKLRHILSIKPSLDLCMSDYGSSPLVLGTIHASKGRESERVVCYLNNDEDKKMSESTNYEEEKKVMYVAATRARSEMKVRNLREDFGFGLMRARTAESGRAYMGKKTQSGIMMFTQFGLKEDFDHISLVSGKGYYGNSAENVYAIQKMLSDGITNPREIIILPDYDKNTKIIPYRWRYGLKFEDEKSQFFLGQVRSSCSREISGIFKGISGGEYSTKVIFGAYIIGVATYVLTEDHARSAEIYEPYSKSGFWLCPIIAGWTRLIPKRKKTWFR